MSGNLKYPKVTFDRKVNSRRLV
ncbi:hypothetical protein C361_04787 [Cryptococcus neoformans Tu259-1]|uniref:Uncharacterized protein n=1 Tax=Cryptococcus neoformans Tu259-1 TaxID=1230072 RepID=A0A854QA33_CRYNE|nr:hypothetical protein C368_04676 [Cryptococcus neoformans var. grubii 125.91]OXG17505.1 hypothetical protein C361_04787 [Cryptococcus neoformans var. grubii Tu259-1]